MGVVLGSLGFSWALLGAPCGPKGRPKPPKSGTKWRPGSARAPEGLQIAPGTPQELQNGASGAPFLMKMSEKAVTITVVVAVGIVVLVAVVVVVFVVVVAVCSNADTHQKWCEMIYIA